MASMAISAATSSSPVQATTSASVAAVHTEAVASSSSRLGSDTVKISVAAQAKMMHRQGMSPSVIASTLGAQVSDVNGYLGIKAATQTAAASSTPTPTVEAPESGSGSTSSTPASSGTETVSSNQAQPAAATPDTTVQAASTNALTASSLTQAIGPALTPMDLTVLPGKG